MDIFAISCVFLCAVLMPLPVNATPDEVQTVLVTGGNANDKLRQAEPTIVSLYGHDDLVRYGDTVMSDVLKRLPGVTMSENKNKVTVISLRGLGAGYTQVLLNGEIMPDGFAIDTIAPETIDHIEITRVAGADTSAQGIAGSINIILKKKTSQTQTEVKWRLNEQYADLEPGVTLSTSGKSGELGYNVSAVIDRSRNDSTDLLTENFMQKAAPNSGTSDTLLSARQLQQATQILRQTATLTPHIHWQLNSDQSLTWQGFFNQVYLHQQKQESETTFYGPTTDFPQNIGVWNGHLTTARNTVAWELGLEDGAKLSLTSAWNFFRRASFFQFWGNDNNDLLLQHRDVSANAHENEFRLNGKYVAPTMENHRLTMGWESSQGQRHEQRVEQDQDPQGNQILYTNLQYDATMTRFALFAQDEWKLSSNWLTYLGLRWEHVGAQTAEQGDFSLTYSENIVSPILQTLWKLNDQQQWRLALNRTLKPPTLVSLIPRIIRIDNDNGPLNPNQQGNPALRAEKSWGLDIAYEQFGANGNMLSASAYARKISDVTLDVLSHQPNGWLVVPTNDGNAAVMGVELESKFSLTSLDSRLPAINMHVNVNRNWSRLLNVPGPDNVMPDQVKLSGNLSADYQMRPAWTLGGNFSWQTNATERASAYLSSNQHPQRRLDLYSQWQLSAQAQMRLSVSNVLHPAVQQSDLYDDAQIRIGQQMKKSASAIWHFLWEQRF